MLRGLMAWLSTNWWVVCFPAAVWVALALFLPATIPGDPRNGPADKVAGDVALEIPVDLSKVSQDIAKAKAVDTVGEALSESLTAIAELGLSLSNESDVQAAVDVSVAEVIEADPQLKDAGASSIEVEITNSLVSQLTMLAESVTDVLPTELETEVREQLVDEAMAEVFATFEDENVRLEDAAFEAAENAVAGIEIPTNVSEEDLTDALANEVASSVSALEGLVKADVENSKIADADADALASEIAEDVNANLDDIVDDVVKTGVDPGDSEEVAAIVESILRESIAGTDTRAQTTPVVAEAIIGRVTRLESIQELGAGPLGGLRDLVSNTLWKASIGVPAAWVLFTFLWAQRHPPKGPPQPPFTDETARAKVRAIEEAWNTHNPAGLAEACTENSVWRSSGVLIPGREAIRDSLTTKWASELDAKVKKELWTYSDNRISVVFKYEWHDNEGQWYRTYGNEHWEFDESGLMRKSEMSTNDIPIDQSEREL